MPNPVVSTEPQIEVRRAEPVRPMEHQTVVDSTIKLDRPPLYRINGKLIPAKMEEMSHEQIEKLIKDLQETLFKSQVDYAVLHAKGAAGGKGGAGGCLFQSRPSR